jgi:hypothetical protein
MIYVTKILFFATVVKNNISTTYPGMKAIIEERHGDREALTFTVECKPFETFDQYKAGAELKQLAEIPLTTELFLAVEEGYDPELIGNEDEVTLRVRMWSISLLRQN